MPSAPAPKPSSPPPTPPAGGPPAPDPRRWRGLAVCLVAGFMALLDVSIVNVALPSIRSATGASPTDLQWVVSGYALAFGLLLIPAGRLGDVRGRRTVFVTGVVLFTVSSTLCGLAPSAGWLIAGRLLQGLAAGLFQPHISGFIQELFHGRERARAFGLLGTTIGLSTAVGPVFGGVLIALFGEEHGWRAVFFVNVPVGIATVLLALRLLPAAAGRRPSVSLDPVGVVLVGTGVLCLLLPLLASRTPEGAAFLVLLPVALVLLAAFAGWERRYARHGREPLVDLTLLRVRSYGLGIALGTVYFAGFTAIFFVFAMFLQTGLGRSALVAGLALTPFAFASAIGSSLGGRLVNRYGRVLVTGGLALVTLGILLTDAVVRRVDGPGIVWALVVPLAVAGLGSGLVISPNVTLTLSEVPVARAGSAGGVLQTGQRIGTALGIAAVGSLLFARVSATGGDWPAAVGTSLLLCAGICALALVLALSDLYLGRRPAPPAAAGR